MQQKFVLPPVCLSSPLSPEIREMLKFFQKKKKRSNLRWSTKSVSSISSSDEKYNNKTFLRNAKYVRAQYFNLTAVKYDRYLLISTFTFAHSALSAFLSEGRVSNACIEIGASPAERI